MDILGSAGADMVCVFFGHRDCPESIKPALTQAITEVFRQNPDCEFLVGSQGGFDRLALSALKQLDFEGRKPDYSIVLAYLPTEKNPATVDNCEPTIYPEGLESVPRRFAIARRNRWMVQQADIVITYVKYSYGGAYRFAEQARKAGKRIIDLAK